MLRIGDTAPNFTVESTDGVINFYEWIGNNWCCLCSHPKAFTPVCTTELGTLASMKPEFDSRGVKIAALSCDTVSEDMCWRQDIQHVGGACLNFPIFSDTDRSIATRYGMLMAGEREDGLPVTVRSVYIIGPDKKIKLIITYPPSTGRNFHEILRAIDALQITENSKLVTPANWTPGDRLIIPPSMNDTAAREKYGEFAVLKPYLRMVNASQVH